MPHTAPEPGSPVKIPLQPFEHYMLADDRSSHSMTCHIRFWFDGNFDQGVFYQALAATLPRHPVFQMTVRGSVRNPTNKIFWYKADRLIMPFVSWASMDSPLDAPAGGFAQDIRNEIGLRFWIRETKDPHHKKTVMLAQFHHSVCDGIGMFQFMEDLLISYGKLSGLAMPPLRKINPDRFFHRGEFSLSEADWKTRRPTDIKRFSKFFRSIATPIAASDKAALGNTRVADLFASERISLPSEVLAGLRSEARASSATVNDLMIRELFLTIAEWNRERGDTRHDIRVGIATSLRGDLDAGLSAANVVSMVFLNRSHEEIAGSDLLSGIVSETSEIKQHRLGITLPRVMRRLGKYPYLVSSFLRLPICSATVILTNLGRPFADSPLTGKDGLLRVGDITLTSLETLPPVRPKTRASISINYYGGSLSITLRYDSTAISWADATKILSQYSQRVSRFRD